MFRIDRLLFQCWCYSSTNTQNVFFFFRLLPLMVSTADHFPPSSTRPCILFCYIYLLDVFHIHNSLWSSFHLHSLSLHLRLHCYLSPVFLFDSIDFHSSSFQCISPPLHALFYLHIPKITHCPHTCLTPSSHTSLPLQTSSYCYSFIVTSLFLT